MQSQIADSLNGYFALLYWVLPGRMDGILNTQNVLVNIEMRDK